MSRKDYVAIADVFAKAADSTVRRTKRDVARELAEEVANVFAADNPAFDRERFLKACGVA